MERGLGLRGFCLNKIPVDFWRERGACRGIMAADFAVLGSGRTMGVVAVKGMNNECGGRTHLGRSGVYFAYSAN